MMAKDKKYGMTKVAVAALKAESSHRSELVSELFIFDAFEIIDEDGEWYQIINQFDGYEGWLLKSQSRDIDENLYFCLEKKTTFTSKLSTKMYWDHKLHRIPRGTFLPEQGLFTSLDIDEPIIAAKEIKFLLPDQAIIISKKYLNAGYLWGGKSPMGLDCSGFVQVLFRMMNINLPRDASQQIDLGVLVDSLEDIHLGDLAFFENEKGAITHVGLMLNSTDIIHASGTIRIDKLDREGIYNETEKRYTHKLRMIKRYIDPELIK